MHSLVSQATVLFLSQDKNGSFGDYQPVDFARCELAIYILGPLSNGKTGNLQHWWGRLKEWEIPQVIPDNTLSKVYIKEWIANV